MNSPVETAIGSASRTGRAPDGFELQEDRLFPSDPRSRDLARELYSTVSSLNVISPHGHVEASMLAEDAAFSDPVSLLLSRDHYVLRLFHADGVDIERLGAGSGAPADPRAAWKIFCDRWHLLEGTASGYWMRDVLGRVLGLPVEPSPANAFTTYEFLQERLREAGMRPRALFERFNIEVLATTDDPLDSLDAHRQIRDDASFSGRVLPTFRPDAYLDPSGSGFVEATERLAAWSGAAVDDYTAYIRALEDRRGYFIEHGAVSADHGVHDLLTVDLDALEAASMYRRAVRGDLTSEEARVFRGHMLVESARMSVEDGLVMTVHPGVHRDHNDQILNRFGKDVGADIPVSTSFTENLRPLLQRYGLERDFHLVLFTIDETAYSREIAPLAGFYPSVYIGAPWWFLDAPDAIQRFRAATTETAGFSRASGFIDDTRAFLSIPARHDMARRADAVYLARLVLEGRLTHRAAARIIHELTSEQPRKVFKL
ncbi:glucuronate isomerase [Pseudoclavibacter sp. RFBB5]|uniref:glucuronate isomerase n=1 Tax=Pseudoclavibacter sp. RFBB5 TaxID=2080574 RepID=UPI000CE74A45|nr:glucuronate isomerase [Pseudoclavibacter sp. RFBB5]PPG33499.1 glucuronate isomerase [Pseudoclavibacter sp. RFBB5]